MKRDSLKRIMVICFYTLLVVSCQQKTKWQIEEEKFEIKLQATIDKLEANNNSQKAINQMVYLGTDSLQSVYLKNFVNNPKLFLYFSSNTCSPCIEQTVDMIEKFIPNYKDNGNIVFVSPDYPARYRNNCYGKKLLFLEKGKLGLELENSEQPPFLFVLDKNMQILSIHVVNKMDFVRTERYLSELTNSFDIK